MNWNHILEKSWHYLIKCRYLIWLGILAALTEGGSFYSGFNYSASDNDIEKVYDVTRWRPDILNWLSGHRIEILVVSIILFLIGIAILYFSYSARAGLIYGVNVLEDGGGSNFSKDFSAGRKFFWRFLGLRLLIALVLILVAVLVALTFIGAFVIAGSYSGWLILPIALLCIPAVFGFILLAVYLSLASVLAERYIVIKNLPIVESIDKAVHLVRQKLGVVVFAWLINIIINIVSNIVSAIVMIFPALVLIVIVVAAYAIGKMTGLFVAVPLALIFILAVSLFVRGIFTTYLSAYWTLIFKKLTANS